MRSCYNSTIWIFNTSTGLYEQIPIQWFFAPSTARKLGIHHQYGSANWQRGIPFPDQVGEVLGAARVYSKGPLPAPYVGQNHCGAANLWLGQLDKLTVALGNRPNNTPTCCNALGQPCPNCSSGYIPTQVVVFMGGGTVDFAQFNGFWVVVTSGTCQLTVTRAPILVQLSAAPTRQTVVSLNQTTGVSVTFQAPTMDCFTPSATWPVVNWNGNGVRPTCQTTVQ